MRSLEVVSDCEGVALVRSATGDRNVAATGSVGRRQDRDGLLPHGQRDAVEERSEDWRRREVCGDLVRKRLELKTVWQRGEFWADGAVADGNVKRDTIAVIQGH